MLSPLVKTPKRLFSRITTTDDTESTFISNTAHELRGPLADIREQAEKLHSDDDKVRQRALEQVFMNIDRCDRLAEQLLNLSRVESLPNQKLKDNKQGEKINWEKIIWDEVAEQQNANSEKAMQIVLPDFNNTHFAGPAQNGNTALWQLLFRNLLDNAIRYSPAGSRIEILLENEVLKITNETCHLDEENLKRLGERFYRPAGQEERGSGLGLSIVSRVAAIHNCQISFSIEEDKRFSVTIASLS